MNAARMPLAAAVLALVACNDESEPAPPAPSAVAAAARPAASSPPAPDLASCPARELLEEGLRERSEPIEVPATLRGVMRSDTDNFALTTLGGATVCVDASWMEGIRNPALSPDGRFASFDWGGYEAFGHVIVDRAGNGQVIETGVTPAASPSGTLLAAADLSESGYGALNAFAVWRIEPAGIRALASHEAIPPAYDWRIDGWAGETCIELSAVAWETFSAGSSGSRDPFRARASHGWRVEQGRCASE